MADLMAEHRTVHELIDREESASFSEVRRYLRLPGFSDTGEGIEKSALATLDYLRGIGVADARLVETEGNPVVFGTLRSKRPGAKTLIVYGLYDLTPVVAEEWSADPLGASIVDAASIGLDPAIGQVLVSRGAHNHRGPGLATLLAVEAMLRTEGDVPCNLIFVIEGEEEIGSPSLPGFIEAHRDELAGAQGAWLPCMYEGADGTMTTMRGFKGSFWVELRCTGGEWGGTRDGRHLWAGHSAWLDAPMMTLVRALSSLIDDDDRLVIDGLDTLPLDITEEDRRDADELRAKIKANPAIEAAMRKGLNVARLRRGAPLEDLVERFMFGVNANIQGIVGGYTGPTFYTMLPGDAAARLDIRFPRGTDHEELTGLLRRHLDRRDFGDVQITKSYGYPAARTSMDDPLMTAGRRAAAAHGVGVETWPMYNGCCPASLFQSLGSGMPFSFAGLGQGERPHAPDEYIHLDAVNRLMHFTVSHLHAWARA
ncbi:M20/M25/M40 family metallo-hydrolase [Streptosporangium sp. NBC_01756]|uniref:M20/M25/M40 family metallo-hydrolase n=1 Tax=Streptosporangium sp. NBC_01756 TaxID=2975950 RepID=UPI002DDB043B|nr:M20/M25/M40 family metallo-hydrolase [Streptosporangium sp. NBC_01756]WSC87956.1 M20/M25/M40 family metallo-hydrolase [Streptosporangium sp. NBC_01756]